MGRGQRLFRISRWPLIDEYVDCWDGGLGNLFFTLSSIQVGPGPPGERAADAVGTMANDRTATIQEPSMPSGA